MNPIINGFVNLLKVNSVNLIESIKFGNLDLLYLRPEDQLFCSHPFPQPTQFSRRKKQTFTLTQPQFFEFYRFESSKVSFRGRPLLNEEEYRLIPSGQIAVAQNTAADHHKNCSTCTQSKPVEKRKVQKKFSDVELIEFGRLVGKFDSVCAIRISVFVLFRYFVLFEFD